MMGVALIAGTALAGTGAAPAFADFPGIDMHRACQTQHGGGQIAWIAGGADVYGWRCAANYHEFINGPNHGIDVDRACRDQHGSDYYAAYGARWDPYSWYCNNWQSYPYPSYP